MKKDIYRFWNLWHGCSKISQGCVNCYFYRRDAQYQEQISSSQCRKTGGIFLPSKEKTGWKR